MPNINLKIIIAEPSAIIRGGLELQLKRMVGFRCQIVEVSGFDSLPESLRINRPDVLIVNPDMIGGVALATLKEESGSHSMKCIALVYSLFEHVRMRAYDEQINIYDSVDEIRHKLERLNTEELVRTEEAEEQQMLSTREKEIVVCVVKGMTNREIAESLFLSTHTVITHRRNIARKLQIHSASGLTIYAIVNKLVELSDIKVEKDG
ncbi:LuxR C-terminal-related transcriptional regulator [Massilibacteroides sp.]|uniref:response regulator transcription factor n=1 Tax=Massilibacteroides sp. TaxID=2034766 RepID=UPI002626A4FA|nr:LuxR C-terminal-related transcriptional regulator [Massilibacteroides sp.]MDD4514954.1 LuxR C-terminal-related transcriptional regulator [Massilibacteroides sp.]